MRGSCWRILSVRCMQSRSQTCRWVSEGRKNTQSPRSSQQSRHQRCKTAWTDSSSGTGGWTRISRSGRHRRWGERRCTGGWRSRRPSTCLSCSRACRRPWRSIGRRWSRERTFQNYRWAWIGRRSTESGQYKWQQLRWRSRCRLFCKTASTGFCRGTACLKSSAGKSYRGTQAWRWMYIGRWRSRMPSTCRPCRVCGLPCTSLYRRRRRHRACWVGVWSAPEAGGKGNAWKTCGNRPAAGAWTPGLQSRQSHFWSHLQAHRRREELSGLQRRYADTSHSLTAVEHAYRQSAAGKQEDWRYQSPHFMDVLQLVQEIVADESGAW